MILIFGGKRGGEEGILIALEELGDGWCFWCCHCELFLEVKKYFLRAVALEFCLIGSLLCRERSVLDDLMKRGRHRGK